MDGHTSLVAPREGDRVVAEDGELGRVDEILRSDAPDAVYFVVAVGRVLRRYPVLHGALVTRVDNLHREVYVRGRRRTLQSLPEQAPIVL